MTCEACVARGKPEHFGSDPKCSFRDGEFTGDNWQCVTTNRIRSLFEREADDFRINHVCEENQHFGTISLMGFLTLPYEDKNEMINAQPTCLWVGWYKNRGRTEGMYLMFENLPPRPPTEAECLVILEQFRSDKECH